MATPDFTARTLRRLLASGVTTRAERLLAKMPNYKQEENRVLAPELFEEFGDVPVQGLLSLDQ